MWTLISSLSSSSSSMPSSSESNSDNVATTTSNPILINANCMNLMIKSPWVKAADAKKIVQHMQLMETERQKLCYSAKSSLEANTLKYLANNVFCAPNAFTFAILCQQSFASVLDELVATNAPFFHAVMDSIQSMKPSTLVYVNQTHQRQLIWTRTSCAGVSLYQKILSRSLASAQKHNDLRLLSKVAEFTRLHSTADKSLRYVSCFDVMTFIMLFHYFNNRGGHLGDHVCLLVEMHLSGQVV